MYFTTSSICTLVRTYVVYLALLVMKGFSKAHYCWTTRKSRIQWSFKLIAKSQFSNRSYGCKR